MAQGSVTVIENYGTSQTDTVVISPPASKKIFVWNVMLTTTEAGTAEVKFATSQNKVIVNNTISVNKRTNMFMEGNIDEDITITCPANTDLILFYDIL